MGDYCKNIGSQAFDRIQDAKDRGDMSRGPSLLWGDKEASIGINVFTFLPGLIMIPSHHQSEKLELPFHVGVMGLAHSHGVVSRSTDGEKGDHI